jgi:outer membrane protein TolC
MSQNTAVEVGAQLVLDEGGETAAVGAPLAGCFEEGLEPLGDDLVQEGLLGLPSPVSNERCAGGASVTLPGLPAVARGGHAGPPRKGRASRLASATGSMTPQTNPFAYDPWNRLWGGLGVGLRGTIDFGRMPADTAQAAAEVEKARAEAEAAVRAVRVEAARAHAALRSALDRAARLRDEEAAARRWLAQAELGFDAGLSEAEPVLLAAVAIARAGAERLAAARDAQVAAADLALAVGDDPRAVSGGR